MCMNTLDRNTPEYYFSITSQVEELIESNKKSGQPIILDGKEITSEHFLPGRARTKDTGYDVRCAEPNGLELIPGAYFKMKLGFRMFAPDGWWLSLAPRSGTFVNHNVHALYGVIDETYENELCFVGQYVPDTTKLISPTNKIVIAFGQRFAQVIPAPRWEMPVIQVSNQAMEKLYKDRNDPRGTGGYGSSGIS